MAVLVPSQLGCFGGRLVRHGVNRWLWPDGEAERRVHEIATALWNIPQRPYGGADGRGFVEVPYVQAQAYDPLTWVVKACREGAYELDVSSFFPGQFRHAQAAAGQVHGNAGGSTCGVASGDGVAVVLVPLEQWKSWRALCACVPLWNPADEAALFARARAGGWQN